MYLQRIAISGFKSFCDRVDFDFGRGVTCVVGPNGCGKSNIVDAFKWVLGEQSAKSLRGRQMTDMIFNGSSTRRSSSAAQVDLIFDNRDRALPLDMDEITVTRRLYRSGESEYMLNQDASRLKDIRELFLDTGVGVDSYSVIEQGRVDGLLQSNPQDRRMIFEEAAGISRYKSRKKEAERKLERTQQNLLRVADIVEELEKRLRSVKLQAGKARNYLEYETRLKELRSSFALAEYDRFTRELVRLCGEADALSDQATALRTDIGLQEAAESRTTLALDALSEEISASDGRVLSTRADLSTREERIASGLRRLEEQSVQESRCAERLAGDGARLEQARKELADVEASAFDLEEQSRRLRETVDAANEQDRVLARELTQAQAVLEDEKAGIIELLRKSAQTHNEIIRLNTQRESLVDQKGRLTQRGAQITVELEGHLRQKAELELRLSEVESLIAEETRRLNEKKEEASRAHALAQRLVDELAKTKEQRSASLSRLEVLRELERKREGVGAGSAFLLEAKQSGSHSGRLDCVAGLVADLFETDPPTTEIAAVIEAALGDYDQYLVITRQRDFLAALEEWEELPGRVTALCLDRLPPIVNDGRPISEPPGFVARAVDLVRFPADFAPLLQHLLGKTVVMESLESALEAAARDLHGRRFVTRQGQVVESDGRVSLGPGSSRAGLISRKAELKEIEGHLVELDARIVMLGDQLNRTQAEVGHLDAVQQELRSAIYESNTARVEANAALQNIRESLDRLTGEQPLIAGEVAFLDQQIHEVLSRSEQGGRSLETLEHQNRERQIRVEAHQTRIDEIVGARRENADRLTETKVSLGQLTEKRAAAAESINVLRRGIRETEASITTLQHDWDQCRSRIAEAEQTVEVNRSQAEELSSRLAEQEIECTRLRQHREQLRVELEAIGQAMKSARAELSAVEEQHHKRQMTLAETRVRRDELASRVSEELGIDLAHRYAEYVSQEHDWQQMETEIAELRRKMERLGNVNLDAIAELQELEERYGFLTAQRDDLLEAQRQLVQLIGRLNDESRQRFQTVFEQIREHFRTMFRRLFGGGRADIVLEDPENILDCGVEIVAQPPGKDLQIISLMSGGEKSMTAIALLMSIFQSRPAPFVILDEVDAALDEANNERFNRIVQEFVGNTQFIIITHSKWTMNTADRLYGITMQEPGVSTRVSVELTGASVA